MTVLRDISMLWSLFHILILFMLLYRSRYPRKKTLILTGMTTTPLSVLSDIVLTGTEKQLAAAGTDIKIVLDVKEATASVSAADKTVVEMALNGSLAKGYTLGQYLDINLYKIIGNSRSIVTNTNGKIIVTIAVPDSLKNTDSTKARTFGVIRVHDGGDEEGNCLRHHRLGEAGRKDQEMACAGGDLRSAGIEFYRKWNQFEAALMRSLKFYLRGENLRIFRIYHRNRHARKDAQKTPWRGGGAQDHSCEW